MVQVTKTWRELGFKDVPETQVQVEKGTDLFEQLSDAEKEKILGKAAFQAYKNGAVKLEDFVGRKVDKRWGSMRYARSLRDILGAKETKKWMEKALQADDVTTSDIIEYLSNPKLSLPKSLDTSDLVEQITEAHNTDGGSTFNPYFGNLKGKKLYAVSVIDHRILRAFIEENLDLLRDPRNSVGTWFDTDEDLTYLDVSATLSDKQLTIRLGKKYDQIGIYDLESDTVIDTGGTGEPPPQMASPEKRLPPLLPKIRPKAKG
ncbi:MAG: hypothetical protein M1343_09920 [Chloroflexi bacterium]|nr:hypothetical protein [Chloroflexota bacterium]